jgi:hypothetical protein
MSLIVCLIHLFEQLIASQQLQVTVNHHHLLSRQQANKQIPQYRIISVMLLAAYFLD